MDCPIWGFEGGKYSLAKMGMMEKVPQMKFSDGDEILTPHPMETSSPNIFFF
jgi:hypothetical protein